MSGDRNEFKIQRSPTPQKTTPTTTGATASPSFWAQLSSELDKLTFTEKLVYSISALLILEALTVITMGAFGVVALGLALVAGAIGIGTGLLGVIISGGSTPPPAPPTGGEQDEAPLLQDHKEDDSPRDSSDARSDYRPNPTRQPMHQFPPDEEDDRKVDVLETRPPQDYQPPAPQYLPDPDDPDDDSSTLSLRFPRGSRQNQ